jgi:hypothetical protein
LLDSLATCVFVGLLLGVMLLLHLTSRHSTVHTTSTQR